MGWVALLEAVHALHWIGMGVGRALTHHAHSGVGPSQALASAWLMLRARSGDPAEAMRALRPLARARRDRIVLEALLDCLERPGADHGATLARALKELDPEGRRRIGRRWWPTYRRLDPRGRTRLRH